MRVNYQLNKDLDKHMALAFLGHSAAGVDFTGGIVGPHPELKDLALRSKNEQKEVISSYFNRFYQENESALKTKQQEFQTEWDKIEDRFFKEATLLFENKITPADKYTGYLSIINCNPRFVKDNSFQVFWQHQAGSVYVTAHEIIHFLFFAYIKQYHPDTLGKMNTDDGLLWQLSELFNDVVLLLPEFVSIHQQAKLVNFYPELGGYQKQAEYLWREDRGIDYWLKRMATLPLES